MGAHQTDISKAFKTCIWALPTSIEFVFLEQSMAFATCKLQGLLRRTCWVRTRSPELWWWMEAELHDSSFLSFLDCPGYGFSYWVSLCEGVRMVWRGSWFPHFLFPASLLILETTERVHVLWRKDRAPWSGKDSRDLHGVSGWPGEILRLRRLGWYRSGGRRIKYSR